jgi:hypothetical protein
MPATYTFRAQSHAALDLVAEDTVLRHQILDPEQEFLVH